MSHRILGLGLLALILGGCGTLSKVDREGMLQGDAVWPDVDKDGTFDHHRGTYGDMNRIARIKDGTTRDQIYEAIGRPQFGEGFHVREWDYVFYFDQEDGSELTCQYKVLFDHNLRARSFYWKTVSPQGAHCPPAQTVNLSTDALFRFDGAALGDVLDDGRAELDRLAGMLRDQQIKSIEITGYTDRIGTSVYNQRLSAQRAATVRNYLVAKGISSQKITAKGRGEADPVKFCPNISGRDGLITCLQPNRRVKVKIVR